MMAATSSIFQGIYAKLLKSNINLFNKAYILTGTADPTSVATDGPKGSLYLRQTASGSGQIYKKNDNGTTTNWEMLSANANNSSAYADLYDLSNATLPASAPTTIDGVTVVSGHTVFFSNLSSGNKTIYEATVSGPSITWTAQDGAFRGGSSTIGVGESVYIGLGDVYSGHTVQQNSLNNFVVNDYVRFFDGNKGTDYWELSSIKTVALSDNVSNATVFSVNVAGSENWVINYSLTRASGQSETGQIFLTVDDTLTASVAVANSQIGVPGVSFDATVSAGVLYLRYSTTNTGSSGVMKLFTQRWSSASGGPAGIPSYSAAPVSLVTAAGSTYDIQWRGTLGYLDADTRLKWDATNNAINQNGMLNLGLSSGITLNDNQVSAADLITVADSYKFFVVDYSITRDSDAQVGRLLVTHNSVITSITDDSTQTAAVGVTFSAVLSGGNLIIRYTTTNTGFSGTFKYSGKLWS
jgi:hypothetical protein